MASSYPGSIPSFTTKQDQIDVNYAAHINRLQDEVRALATELGIDPRGDDADVRNRLDGLQSSKSDVGHNHDGRYWQRSLITTKGQLLVGTGSQNLAALPPAASGRALITDPSTPTGLRWATLDFGLFGSLSGDHFPQYALANGTRGAFLRTAGGTMNGPVVLDGYSEKVVNRGNISGTANFNVNDGSMFRATIVAPTTFSFSGATSGQGATITLVVTQDATGNRSYTWPASVRWMGSGPPQPGTGGQVMTASFLTVDGGSTWLGVALTEFVD